MRITSILHVLFFVAAGVAGHAKAQVDYFSMHFEEIKFEYANARSGPVPFRLDLVLGEDGTVDILPFRGHDLVFDAAQFHSADPQPESWLHFEMESSRPGARGLLSIGIDLFRSRGGGPHIEVLDGSSTSGRSAHVGGAHFLLADGSVRFANDSAAVRLSGAPAALFNRPAPGEPLEATLPTPAPGQTIELNLSVWDDRGARMTMPVRIRTPH